ncbi:hypothetical protein [Mesorhizobium sp. STM 4661]|uniref:hypothetical protein n=1 Tax=Mesorhizobium sp. STM 4661 TaxID=1297570 RepID=UPI0002BD524F|nr:hypothetical protein [Mesorhizobium sp. STM 4661]CCV14976.1 hypothetical protein MESS4_720090 [Mesorhizobium sp. STM 4661]
MARPATAAVRLLTGEREPVRLATTANVILNGLQTIDGVPAEAGDRVLAKDQVDPTQNGIYTASEGEWFRAADARTARTLQKGTTVHTQVGSINADRVFEFTVNEPVVGIDAIAIAAFVPPDISDVVDEVEALRDETQVLKDAAEVSAGQAAASASASAANAGQTAADVVTTAANLASAQAARDASLYGKGIFPTIAAAIGPGVIGSGAITGGSGGTDGTFDLAFAGGTGSGAAGRFVVAGGALTQIIITAPGSYTVAPSFSFAASAGLTGASAAVVLGRNVDVGEYFWTEVSAGIMGMYRVAAGPVAVDTGVRASAAEVIALIGSRTVGPVPITGSVGGTAVGNNSVYYWPTTLAAVDEYLSSLELGFGAAAGTIQIICSHVEGDGTLSAVSEQTISVPAGPSSVVSGLSILKPAGSVMGLKRGAGTWYYLAGTIPNGESEWFTASVPTSHTAKTIATTNGPQWKPTFTGEVGVKARAAYETSNDLLDVVGTETLVGWPNLVNTGTNTPANYSVIVQAPQPVDGFITQVDVGAAGTGASRIHVVEYLGGLTINVISTHDITLSNGVLPIPLSIPIMAGQYPAISGGLYKYQPGANPEGIRAWVRSGVLSNGAVVIDQATHRFEVAFTIKTGLLAQAALALGGGAQNTGMGLLDDADPNGVVDATAIFATAAAAHPNPYAPPGSFALTTISATGNGFYGPGKPKVNGVTFFIPERPSLNNLYDAFRAELAEHIANNDVLAPIGDSKDHWAFASTGDTHWFNLVTRFANLGIAADEPIMTALRPSSTYTPDFYGLTTSGSVSTGSRGPLGESLILADGASMICAPKAYEQVDVFFTQEPGSGSLAFAYNGGAVYKTVNAAGVLALDQYTGPSLTGQVASGTYTITAVGGPVEITGLVRLGVKVAGSRPRLRTARFAHGSYAFSSFNTARLTSAMAQASAFGGKLVPIIPLGINDSFGTPPASIITNMNSVLNTLEAGGCPRMFAMPPTRPSGGWDGSYTGGRTYDAANGAIRQTYRARSSVALFPLDGFDWLAAGFTQDGLHNNDNGEYRKALVLIAGVAAGRR